MENFYDALTTYYDKTSWFNNDAFTDFDGRWMMVISDVVGSTKAIDAGKYKEVNIAGALVIIALLNIAKNHNLPFVFGGDGATVLFPPSLNNEANTVLSAVIFRVKESFGLDLRVGICSVQALYEQGCSLRVLKYSTEGYFNQAIFQGDAISHFDAQIKQHNFELLSAKDADINLEGFECRWRDIYISNKFALSIIVEIKPSSKLSYASVLEHIDTIFSTQRSVISAQMLHLDFSKEQLQAEAQIKKKSWVSHLFENVLGALLIYFKMRLQNVDWGRYKDDVSAANDSEKFDSALKLVIAADASAIKRFEHFLREHKAELFYGMHQSDRAIMTCLVYERNGAQVHFVDSADGGYAMAAKMLKEQMRRVK